MTIDYQSSEGVLNRELARVESLVVLRDALRAVGGLQQSADEAGKRLDAAKAAEVSAKADLAAIEQQVENAKAEIATASAAADSVIVKAKVAASAIVAGAEATAAKIVADAEIKTSDALKRAQVLSEAIKQAAS